MSQNNKYNLILMISFLIVLLILFPKKKDQKKACEYDVYIATFKNNTLLDIIVISIILGWLRLLPFWPYI